MTACISQSQTTEWHNLDKNIPSIPSTSTLERPTSVCVANFVHSKKQRKSLCFDINSLSVWLIIMIIYESVKMWIGRPTAGYLLLTILARYSPTNSLSSRKILFDNLPLIDSSVQHFQWTIDDIIFYLLFGDSWIHSFSILIRAVNWVHDCSRCQMAAAKWNEWKIEIVFS